MEIFLVRHTTPDIEKGICYGQTDLDITDTFQNEVNAVKNHIPVGDHAIYSSPLKRCTLLAHELGTTVCTDKRLMELNFGQWEMQAWDKIPQESLQPWMDDFVNEAPPEGESYVQLKERAMECFNDITTKNHKSVAIVCHGGVIRALLATILNIELKDSFQIKIPYGHVVHLTKYNDKFQIKHGLSIETM